VTNPLTRIRRAVARSAVLLLLTGAIKAGYDLALWRWARHLPLAATAKPDSTPATPAAAATPGGTS